MTAGIRILNSKALQRKLNNLPAAAAKELEKGIAAGLVMVQNEARRSIQKGPKSGRIYKKGGVTHQASSPGEAPATDSGRLVSHINHKMEGLKGTVGVHELSLVKYARRLEFGGRDKRGTYIAPRPFLFKAYKKKRKAIRDRLIKALPVSMRKSFGVR